MVCRYIAQTNPNGWTPTAVLNLVAGNIPLCVAGVRAYLEQQGPPPMLRHTAGVLVAFTFTPSKDRYVAEWRWTPEPAHPATLLLLSRKRFPGGATLTFDPPNVFDVAWMSDKVRTRLVSFPCPSSIELTRARHTPPVGDRSTL